MTHNTSFHTDHLMQYTVLTFGGHHTSGRYQTNSQLPVERQIALLVLSNFISLKKTQVNSHATVYAKADYFTLSPGEWLTFAKDTALW